MYIDNSPKYFHEFPIYAFFLVLYNVKITDFGLSKTVGGLSMAQSLVGTHPYTAPEVFFGGPYDFSSDIWSPLCLFLG